VPEIARMARLFSGLSSTEGDVPEIARMARLFSGLFKRKFPHTTGRKSVTRASKSTETIGAPAKRGGLAVLRTLHRIEPPQRPC
jgi:hypothetical protein